MTDRPYWNMAVEPLLGTPAMEKIQLEKIKGMLARLIRDSLFFGPRIRSAGLDPDRLTGLTEFREKMPLFDKRALMDLVAECGGDFLTALSRIMPVPVADLAYIATTTGTTGLPTPYPLTAHDIRGFWGEVISRAYWRAGVRKGDRILFCFALSMVFAGIPTMLGMERIGATIIPVGAEAKSERILRTQALYRGTVFAGTPSLAEYLIERSPEMLGIEAHELGFKALFCGGEPGAGIPEIRVKLEKAYRARVYDAGAGLGCSCDHPEYQGMHWLADDLCYYELVDSETRAPLPLENGQVGEAVFTTLEGEAAVQLRNGLGDIHQVFTDPCPCGRTGFRYKIIGRRDEMMKIKGVMIYPSHIRGVVNEFVPRVTGEMRVVLTEPLPRVVPPLKLRLEYGPHTPPEALPALENEIAEALHHRYSVRPRILWTAPGTLPRSHYKGQVFEFEKE